MGAAAAVEIIVLYYEKRNSYWDNFIVLGVEKTMSRYLILLFSCVPPPPPCCFQGCGSVYFGQIRFRCHEMLDFFPKSDPDSIFFQGRNRIRLISTRIRNSACCRYFSAWYKDAFFCYNMDQKNGKIIVINFETNEWPCTKPFFCDIR